jgi:hypothetical protein
MAQNHPTVQEDTLIYQLDGQTREIMLGTSEWYAWLGLATTFTFRSATGIFTARRERAGNKRGRWYWKAYRKRGGKLFSAYLGKSEALTVKRLHAVMAQLNGEHGLTTSQLLDANTPGGAPLRALTTTAPEPLPHVGQPSRPKQMRFFNLPSQLTSLVGREQDTAQVCALLRRPEVRLSTLVGTGGVGKTRLALAAAAKLHDEFADGVIFISLAPILDHNLVIPTIASMLGLPRGTLWDVQHYLQDRHLLLVLDNFEHVSHAAPEIEEVLLACPPIAASCSARDALGSQRPSHYPTRASEHQCEQERYVAREI